MQCVKLIKGILMLSHVFVPQYKNAQREIIPCKTLQISLITSPQVDQCQKTGGVS